ncbi:hypothetical protein [Consotaella salsifontis]|uniref:Cell division and transport-associated protein TolA n=1 Tax=Consotaella salsifontis TaxID=1365950 RepID=A0A1T4REI0_9HYPH|nr:hypothetical protein [Consotaella salsifontis]SKA14422.1 Cell division and transport-associated protein TolA [Consotaella salsifontis]
MKTGLAASAAIHVAALTWGMWSLSSPHPLDATYSEALPVEIVMGDTFQGVKGEKTAPIREKPAPAPTKKPQTLPMPAENVGDNEADLKTPPVPEVRPNRSETQAASAPPPPPPPPAKTEPAPKPAEPVAKQEPAPEKAPEPKAEPKPKDDPIEEMIADAADSKPEEPTPPAHVPVPVKKPAAPAPQQVAEAKPTPQPSTSKQTSSSKTQADQSSDSKFNADQIAALLSQEKASGGGAKRSTEPAALGSRETTGSVLTRSELGELQGMIKDQMARCWSPPTGGTGADSVKISIKMELDPSGTLQGMPSIVSGGGGSGVERAAAEAALRAVRRCSPYNLPADKYQAWSEVTLNFDPSEMY